jgi:hypothetical protein
VQEDGASQRSGLIAAAFRAHVVFQIFAEVFAGIVEGLTAFLQTADEKCAFESSDDELREFLRMNRGIDLRICDASANNVG